ncbi:hypothetical protein BGX27_004382, partial [Mortierella sp. AM989]
MPPRKLNNDSNDDNVDDDNNDNIDNDDEKKKRFSDEQFGAILDFMEDKTNYSSITNLGGIRNGGKKRVDAFVPLVEYYRRRMTGMPELAKGLDWQLLTAKDFMTRWDRMAARIKKPPTGDGKYSGTDSKKAAAIEKSIHIRVRAIITGSPTIDPVATMTVGKRPLDSTSPLRPATTRQADVDAFFRVGNGASPSTSRPSAAFKDWRPSATVAIAATTASVTSYSIAVESDENVPYADTLAFTDTEDDY